MSIVIPIVAMAAWLSSVIFLEKGATVVLPIAGYDPRDLLSGHFLSYSVEYGMSACDITPNEESDARCVCLSKPKAPEKSKATWAGHCSELRDTCSLYLRGECQGRRFIADIERFYFDERHATALAVVPPNGSISVSVRNGFGIVTGLFVDDLPLEQWLAQKKPAAK